MAWSLISTVLQRVTKPRVSTDDEAVTLVTTQLRNALLKLERRNELNLGARRVVPLKGDAARQVAKMSDASERLGKALEALVGPHKFEVRDVTASDQNRVNITVDRALPFVPKGTGRDSHRRSAGSGHSPGDPDERRTRTDGPSRRGDDGRNTYEIDDMTHFLNDDDKGKDD